MGQVRKTKDVVDVLGCEANLQQEEDQHRSPGLEVGHELAVEADHAKMSQDRNGRAVDHHPTKETCASAGARLHVEVGHGEVFQAFHRLEAHVEQGRRGKED